MWYFIAKWKDYNTTVTAQFMSLDDIVKWWEVETSENSNAWGLEIYDRMGCRIFTKITKPYAGQTEQYNKLGWKYIDLTDN